VYLFTLFIFALWFFEVLPLFGRKNSQSWAKWKKMLIIFYLSVRFKKEFQLLRATKKKFLGLTSSKNLPKIQSFEF